MTKFTTLLAQNDVYEDGELSEQARMSAIVEEGGSNDFQNNASVTKEMRVITGAADLNKNELEDWTADENIVDSGETVTTKLPETGDEYLLWLAVGENVSKNDKLRPDVSGDGTLVIVDGTETLPTSNSYTINQPASIEGNALYVTEDNDGRAYFESNMANDTSDKYIDFNGVTVKIHHNGTPGGSQVYLKSSNDKGSRLVANAGNDLRVKGVNSEQVVLVADDGSASGGAAINYDDATDEQLETAADTNSVDIYTFLEYEEFEAPLKAQEDVDNSGGSNPVRIETKYVI